jgi:V/A-type H+-transporting ATPase subunit I
MISRREPLKAVFGGHGIIALTFYMAGIYMALAFIGQLSFNAFFQPNVFPITAVALISLALVFLSPLIESRIQRQKAKPVEKVLEGFGEGLETFISFTANSVSYIRLAAFAIAHGALALAAGIFAAVIGNVPSLIFMNVIVFLVEGFSAFIQSLRLMYYEFSTKFYAGDGIAYKPFETIKQKA